MFMLVTPRLTVRRAFATDRFVAEPLTGEADENGMRLESPHGRTELPWALMHKVVMTADLVTIYQSATLIRILPRQFFADEESWQAFRRFATAAPVAKPALRPARTFLVWLGIIFVVFILWELLRGVAR